MSIAVMTSPRAEAALNIVAKEVCKLDTLARLEMSVGVATFQLFEKYAFSEMK